MLADYRRVLGEDHPDTLASRNNLAYAYRAAGRLDEAITGFEQLLADYRRVLGENHPDTLISRHNLAIDYQDAGRLDESRAIQDQGKIQGLAGNPRSGGRPPA